MALFALADLHFSFAKPKPMDIFGENWKNHADRIITQWNNTVTSQDTILLPGDISWAMHLSDAKKDLSVIDNLPGKKILLSGNHDYWWKSSAKLEGQFPHMKFLKNGTIPYDDYFICGTRGWTCPNDISFTKEDEKIYNREQIRLRLSLDMAMYQGAKKIIVMLHYPPVNDKHEPSAFTEIFKSYPVTTVIYGHLHGAQNHKQALQGCFDAITYHLVASDYIDFCPKRIL